MRAKIQIQDSARFGYTPIGQVRVHYGQLKLEDRRLSLSLDVADWDAGEPHLVAAAKLNPQLNSRFLKNQWEYAYTDSQGKEHGRCDLVLFDAPASRTRIQWDLPLFANPFSIIEGDNEWKSIFFLGELRDVVPVYHATPHHGAEIYTGPKNTPTIFGSIRLRAVWSRALRGAGDTTPQAP